MSIVLGAYLGVLLLTCIVCIIKWAELRSGDRLIGILMNITLLSELVAVIMAHHVGNAFVVYHFFNPIQFLLISLYFNRSISLFRRKNLGLKMGLLGIVVSILNSFFLQEITGINSYFLLFEATSTVLYCLLSFHELLLDERDLPYSFAQFWITLCLMIFWTANFTGWGIYTRMAKFQPELYFIFLRVLTVTNFIFYLGVATVFLHYKKLTPSGE